MRAAAQELAQIVRPTPPKWNISKLARHFGVDRSVVRGWADGTQIPTLDQIVELERLLGIVRDGWLRECGKTPSRKAKANGKNSRRLSERTGAA